MLCISCGSEMRLVRVQPDDTMMVKGYEYQTFECPSCQETERRLTFTREPTPQPVLTTPDDKAAAPPEPAAQDAAPPVSPNSAHQDEAVPASSADSKAPDQPAPPVSPAADRIETPPPSRWARAVARLRGMQERGS